MRSKLVGKVSTQYQQIEVRVLDQRIKLKAFNLTEERFAHELEFSVGELLQLVRILEEIVEEGKGSGILPCGDDGDEIHIWLDQNYFVNIRIKFCAWTRTLSRRSFFTSKSGIKLHISRADELLSLLTEGKRMILQELRSSVD